MLLLSKRRTEKYVEVVSIKIREILATMRESLKRHQGITASFRLLQILYNLPSLFFCEIRVLFKVLVLFLQIRNQNEELNVKNKIINMEFI